MRELKFRALFNGKMHDDIVIIDAEYCLARKDTGCPLNAGIADFLSHDDPSSPMVLMQYTGLKDKNGKEIYEGDILRFDFYYRPMVVEYEGWGFGCIRDDGIKEMPNKEYREVIGNIYENKELLK
jgi:hypothetical protein